MGRDANGKVTRDTHIDRIERALSHGGGTLTWKTDQHAVITDPNGVKVGEFTLDRTDKFMGGSLYGVGYVKGRTRSQSAALADFTKRIEEVYGEH